MEVAETEEHDQQTGHYYELEKNNMTCAEKAAQEDLGTASVEGVGDAERLFLNQVYWQAEACVFSVLFPVYLE